MNAAATAAPSREAAKKCGPSPKRWVGANKLPGLKILLFSPDATRAAITPRAGAGNAA